MASGVTVGNSPLMPDGVIVAPGMGASVVGGSGGTGGTELPTGEGLRWLTTVATVASAGDNGAASTVTVRVIGAPAVAAALTWSVIISSNAWLAGSVPIVHVVPCAAGHSVYRGNLIERALLDALTTTLLAGTVLQTQIEYVTVPPGLVFELCCTSWPVTQSAPGLCDVLGDGDGLGERDLDGLGLVVADGLGLFDLVGLVDLLGLGELEELREALALGLVAGLELAGDVALADGLAVAGIASRCADTAAAEPCLHGDLAGAAAEAKAGAMAIPMARNDPAIMATATRPARSIPASHRIAGRRAVSASMTRVLTVRLGGHVFEHKLAARLTEVAGAKARAYRLIMILFRQRITSVFEMAV